jgi:hypothetical protein
MRRPAWDRPADMSRYPILTFQHLAGQADLVPVYHQLVSDTLTPVSAYCRIQQRRFVRKRGRRRADRPPVFGGGPVSPVDAFGNRVVVCTEGVKRAVTDPLRELGCRWRVQTVHVRLTALLRRRSRLCRI